MNICSVLLNIKMSIAAITQLVYFFLLKSINTLHHQMHNKKVCMPCFLNNLNFFVYYFMPLNDGEEVQRKVRSRN